MPLLHYRTAPAKSRAPETLVPSKLSQDARTEEVLCDAAEDSDALVKILRFLSAALRCIITLKIRQPHITLKIKTIQNTVMPFKAICQWINNILISRKNYP